MEIRQLEAFIAILDEGSFSAASRRLRMSLSSLSARIAALERNAKGPLLERRPRVIPTPAGIALEPYARRILADVDAAVTAMRPPHPVRERLVIGLMADGAAELNAPLFRVLLHALPEVDVRITHLPLSVTEAAVVDGLVDVAILRSPIGDPRLEAASLFTAPRVVVASRTGPLAGAETLVVEDLENLPLTGTHPTQSNAFRDFFELRRERNGETPRLVLPAYSLADAARHMLESGAIATPTSDARQIMDVNRFVIVPLLDAPPSGPIAVCRSDDHRRVTRTFMRAATSVAAECISLVPDALISDKTKPAPSLGPWVRS